MLFSAPFSVCVPAPVPVLCVPAPYDLQIKHWRRDKSREMKRIYEKVYHRKRRVSKGSSLFQSCQGYQAFLKEARWQRERRRNKSSRLHRLLSLVRAESITNDSITPVNPNGSKTSFRHFKNMFIHIQLNITLL